MYIIHIWVERGIGCSIKACSTNLLENNKGINGSEPRSSFFAMGRPILRPLSSQGNVKAGPFWASVIPYSATLGTVFWNVSQNRILHHLTKIIFGPHCPTFRNVARSILIFTRCRIWEADELMIHAAAAHPAAARRLQGSALGQHDGLLGWQEARHGLVWVEGDGQYLLFLDLGSGTGGRWPNLVCLLTVKCGIVWMTEGEIM
jgi:hypothetical protein